MTASAKRSIDHDVAGLGIHAFENFGRQNGYVDSHWRIGKRELRERESEIRTILDIGRFFKALKPLVMATVFERQGASRR